MLIINGKDVTSDFAGELLPLPKPEEEVVVEAPTKEEKLEVKDPDKFHLLI